MLTQRRVAVCDVKLLDDLKRQRLLRLGMALMPAVPIDTDVNTHLTAANSFLRDLVASCFP
eukprot:12703824-Heterocapsa_arctica.AAC.1